MNAILTLSGQSPSSASPRVAQGFTLIELMITISIAAILLAVGIPSMRDMIQQNRLTGNVNEFVAANMLARSEAIKRGSPVTLCRAVNAESGSDACSTAGGGWETGWVVRAGSADNIAVLARQKALSAGTTVTSTSNAITYTGMGQPTIVGDSVFTFANDCKLKGRVMTISRFGHSSVNDVPAAGC